MNKLFFFSICYFLLIFAANSQARFGRTLEQINNEFSDPNMQTEILVDEYDRIFLQTYSPYYKIQYLFNKDQINTQVFVFPKDIYIYRETIRNYDNQYTKIEGDYWRWYHQLGVSDIQILRSEGQIPVIIITLLQSEVVNTKNNYLKKTDLID